MSELPSVIGRYQIRDVLGRGGMGLVYRAWDPALSREVVVKVTQVDEPAFRRRFLREARAAGCLNHEAIVTIFDAGEFEGQLFIVMEYVEGRTVGQIIKAAEKWPMLRCLRLMRDLCDGLAFAHARGIVHRDVKPDNLMVRDADGTLAILDFGIARMEESTSPSGESTSPSGVDEGRTVAGGMIGTPHYMAPEQIRGEAVDHRCDVFSVGLVFYELLSHRRAFDADTLTGVIYKILHEEPPSLADQDARLDPAVIRIVERAMAKDPDARYPDLLEARSDFDGVLRGIDGGATILLPSGKPREPVGERSVGDRAEADGATRAAAPFADGGEGGGGASLDVHGAPRGSGFPWFQRGSAGRGALVRSGGALLGGLLLAAGGMWLASPSGGESERRSGADDSASARSPAPPLRNLGADDGGAIEGGVGRPEDARRAPAAVDTPELGVDELLAEANRAFREGRYGTARRLFREARELSAGGFRQPADGVAPARPARARDGGGRAADGPEMVLRGRE